MLSSRSSPDSSMSMPGGCRSRMRVRSDAQHGCVKQSERYRHQIQQTSLRSVATSARARDHWCRTFCSDISPHHPGRGQLATVANESRSRRCDARACAGAHKVSREQPSVNGPHLRQGPTCDQPLGRGARGPRRARPPRRRFGSAPESAAVSPSTGSRHHAAAATIAALSVHIALGGRYARRPSS